MLEKNTEPDAVRYTIHQSTVSGQEGTDILDMNQEDCLEHICESLPLDAPEIGTYYYVIVAHDSAGHRSGPSNEVTLIILNYPPTSPADYIIKTN